jgi:hypothetical protein
MTGILGDQVIELLTCIAVMIPDYPIDVEPGGKQWGEDNFDRGRQLEVADHDDGARLAVSQSAKAAEIHMRVAAKI